MKYKQSRELITKLLEQEIKDNGIKVEILPLTKAENILKIIKKGISKQIITTQAIFDEIKSELYANELTSAYYDYESHKLKVLIDTIKKDSLEKERYLWNLIKTVYHEYKHAIVGQTKTGEIRNKEDLYVTLEDMISPIGDIYLEYHDRFYEEILANQYGIEKADKLFKKRISNTATYKKLRFSIETEKTLHEIYYRNYDVHPFLSVINNTVKKSVHELNLSYLDPKCQIIKVLYNNEGNFKQLSELYQDEDWLKYPKEVQYLIVSSKPYLTDFDFNNATKEELNFILEALNYVEKEEVNRVSMNEFLRLKLDNLSELLDEKDQYSVDFYLTALLTLNKNEKINKEKQEKIKARQEQIKELIHQKDNPPKVKSRFITIDEIRT